MKSVELPAASGGTVRKGIWFVFHQDAHTIRAWGGPGGTERVYVDEEIVSDKRSLKKMNVHSFTVDGVAYQMEFYMESLRKAELNCHLFRAGKLIAAQRATLPKAKFVVGLIAGILTGTLIVACVKVFSLPILPVTIAACVLMGPILALRKREWDVKTVDAADGVFAGTASAGQ